MKTNPQHKAVVDSLLDLCYDTKRDAKRARVYNLAIRLLVAAEQRGFTGWDFCGVSITGWYGQLPVVIGVVSVAGNSFYLSSGDRQRIVVVYRLGERRPVRWDIAKLVLGE